MGKKVVSINGGEQLETPLSMSQVSFRQVISYDKDGQVVADVLRPAFKPNGGGFVLSYTEKMCEFLERTKHGATVRVFLYIAHHQNYGNDGVFGYRCSHKFLRQALRLDRKSVYNALKELKDEYLVNEIVVDGVSEFMVNPQYVTIGIDKKIRTRVWNKRWEMENRKRVATLRRKEIATTTINSSEDVVPEVTSETTTSEVTSETTTSEVTSETTTSEVTSETMTSEVTSETMTSEVTSETMRFQPVELEPVAMPEDFRLKLINKLDGIVNMIRTTNNIIEETVYLLNTKANSVRWDLEDGKVLQESTIKYADWLGKRLANALDNLRYYKHEERMIRNVIR